MVQRDDAVRLEPEITGVCIAKMLGTGLTIEINKDREMNGAP
jgi:hypothetical protein